MLRFEESRAGDRTARYDNTLLHSRYAPRKEAERFVATVRRSRCYVILGAGLGYLAEAVAARYPESRICSLHPSRELAEAADWSPGLHAAPSSAREIPHLLDRAFGPEALYGFELLAWEPGRTAAPEWSEGIERSLLDLARRSHDSLLSTGYFGYSWLANAVTNLAERPEEDPKPVPPLTGYPVLLAPGPTAEGAIPWIREHRPEISLVTVSSATPLLKAAGLEADLLIHTDGGYWATLHLRGHTGAPIAAALKARVPRGARSSVAIFLPDPTSPVELALTGSSPLPFLPIPGHGTVTGTALRILDRLYSAPPLLIGLDLASHGLRGHARPHAFDTLHFSWANRCHTLETLLRSRLRDPILLDPPWMAPRDLTTYAAAFREELSGRGALRLRPSAVPLPASEVSDTWAPPPSPPADLTRITGRGQRVPPEEALRAWTEQFLALEAADIAAPNRNGEEPLALLEELCRLLALPELLRLRRSWDRDEDVRSAFEEIRHRVTDRLTRLIRKVDA